MHLLPLLSLLGLAVAAPLTPAPKNISSLDPFTGKPITSPSSRNSTFNRLSAQSTSNWWYAAIDHSTGAVRDYVPFLYNSDGSPDYDYPTYIAVASGDSQGLINALYSNGPGSSSGGDRYNGWLAGQPRTIYVAPGTYTLTETMYMDTDTIIIGDALNPPTIKASSNFNGDFLIVAGVGGTTGNGGELKFSLELKNLILDTTANAGDSSFTALSWRVAQNSATTNLQINMPQGAHTGVYMGQGSTIQIADISFSYGSIGLHYDGSQQASLKNLKFSDCTVGIQVDGGNTVNIFAPTFNTVGQAIVYNSGGPWVSVLDAVSTNSGTFFNSTEESPNFMLENISKDNTKTAMVVVNGDTKVGGQSSLGSYVYGNTYGANPIYQTNPPIQSLSRSAALAPNGKYPVATVDQYASATVNDVINLKDSAHNGGVTVAGDGSTNDGPNLQTALNTAASAGKIAYLPYGIYRTEVTITIPSGTRLVGNGWSTISGYGSLFSDDSNPQPVVQIGNSGDVGTVDIQNMRFDVGEQLPGAIIVQVNMAGNNPGDVAIHNSLVTVGGTRDSTINCGNEGSCKGAYIGLHLTESSSAYIDNVWCWLADHQTDNDDGMSQGGNTRIAAKAGVLVEATKATWLVGLGEFSACVRHCSREYSANSTIGSEHWWLAQLEFNNAANVLLTFFQSETNYHQGSQLSTSAPPSPFTATGADPNFSWCNGNAECEMGPAMYFNGGSDIVSYAAGSWNFFGGFQTAMNVINQNPDNLRLYGMCDHIQQSDGGKYVMRLADGTMFGDGSSDGYGGSWGSLVAKYTT